MESIVQGTTYIVLDGCFDSESLLYLAGTSAGILASSTKCYVKLYAKGFNWGTD